MDKPTHTLISKQQHKKLLDGDYGKVLQDGMKEIDRLFNMSQDKVGRSIIPPYFIDTKKTPKS